MPGFWDTLLEKSASQPRSDIAQAAQDSRALNTGIVDVSISPNVNNINKYGFTNPVVNRCAKLCASNIATCRPILHFRGKEYHLEEMPTRWKPFFTYWRRKVYDSILNYQVHGYSIWNITVAQNSIFSEVLPATNYRVTTDKDGEIVGIRVDGISSRGLKYGETFRGKDIDGVLLWLDKGTEGDETKAQSVVTMGANTINAHNSATTWILNVTTNGGSMSGFLTYIGDPKNRPKQTQIDALKQKIRKEASGAKNAGNLVTIIGGDWKWTPMGADPKSMMVSQVSDKLAVDICMYFGVPPQLLGIKGASTYANVTVAQQILYVNTLKSLMLSFYETISEHICNQMGLPVGALQISGDLNDLEALQELGNINLQRLNSVTTISLNEKRRRSGVQPIDDPQADEVPALTQGASTSGSMDQPPDREPPESENDDSPPPNDDQPPDPE